MLKTLFSMKDKICVVTGGSLVLGSFVARGFLEAGAFITGQITPVDGGSTLVS